MAEEKEENQPLLIPSSNQKNLVEDVYTGAAEETTFRSPMVSESYLPPYNPDDLWQKRGDYRIYEDMGQDDQVSVCLRLKTDLVLGSGFYFHAEDDDQAELCKELEYLFCEKPDKQLEEMLEEVMSADQFGFSLSEKIFKVLDDGRLTLKILRTRHPNSWKMFQDDKGNVSRYVQFTANGDKDINPKSLIHFINQERFQNPFGNSDLRAAYNAWFTKRQVIKYYAIFLEKAASPTPVAKYDKNAPQQAKHDIFEAIKKLQTKTALAIPKDIEIEFLETTNVGTAYEKAINIFNMFIARSLFVPDLIGLSGGATAGGSFALGKEQMRVFFMHIARKRKAIENMVNKHLVEPIVYWNYGAIENYPKFKFKPLDQSEATELAKLWLEAMKSKLYKPTEEEINYFRKLTQFPEGEIEFFAEQPASPFGQPSSAPQPSMDMPDDNMEEELEDKEIQAEDKKEFAKPYKLPPGDYHKKVNFKAIETKLNDYDQSVLADAQPIVNKIIKDLNAQISKKKILQSGNIDKLETLKLKYLPELRRILTKSFNQLYMDGQSQAAVEIDKTKNFAQPTTPKQFNDIIESEAYQYIADYEYALLKTARTQVIAAIKDGSSIANVTGILDNELKKLSDVSIERYARTKHTEVLNRARVDFFEESGVVAAYQYSAILDGQTSEICSGLDGKIFEAGSEPIPPLHFNCRSTLIPITKYESFKPTETIRGMSPNEFIDENKGKGFSTK